jgi:uncharacterized protein (TIGR02145 family)
MIQFSKKSKFKNMWLVLLTLAALGFSGGQAWAADPTSGVFVSKVQTLTAPTYFGVVSWEATVPAPNTSIKLKVRSADNVNMDGAPGWDTDCTTEYNLTGNGSTSLAGNDCLTTGQKYLQYRAVLATTDGDTVPTLDSVTIAFTYPTTYASKVAPAVDTSDADFAATTQTGDGFYANANNRLFLRKPAGVACDVDGECVSGSTCDGTSHVCYIPPCGMMTVSYGGKTYNTVQIGTQCWFRENLNVGTMLANGNTPPSDPFDSNNIQKWCPMSTGTAGTVAGVESNCTTDGGLYTWAEANGLEHTCNGTTACTPPVNNQGICPTGWHIPSDAEYTILTTYLGGEATAGTSMKTMSSTTFSARLAGRHNADGSFFGRLSYAYFWSASPFSKTDGWNRIISSSIATVIRGAYPKPYGLSVRCLKN